MNQYKFVQLKYIAFFLAVLCLFVALALVGISHRTNGFSEDSVDITRFASVSVLETAPGFPLEMGSSPESLTDGDSRTWWYGKVSDGIPNWIELEWDSEREIDSVSLNFGAGGRIAVDYNIQILINKEWKDALTVTGNEIDSVSNSLRANQVGSKTKKIRVLLLRTKNTGDNLQKVNEVVVTERRSIDFIQGVASHLIAPLGVFAKRYVMAGFFFLILLIPGYVIAKGMRTTLGLDELFVVSFGLTFISIFILTVILLFSGLGLDYLPYLSLFLGIFFLYRFLSKKMYLEIFQAHRFLTTVILVSIFFSVSYETLIIQLGYAFQADYLIPFGAAKIYLKDIDPDSAQASFYLWFWHIADRTPLPGILSAWFMKNFGDGTSIYHILNIVIVSIFFPALYLFLRTLVAHRAAILTVSLILLSPYCIYYFSFHPHRWLTIYFLLLYFYFLVKAVRGGDIERQYLYAGLFGGMSYMAHPMAVIYIACGMIYILLARRAQCFDKLKYLLASIGVFFLTWMVWVKVLYGGRPSLIFLDPFSLEGPAELYHGNPREILRIFFSTPLLEVLKIRGWNLLNAFVFDAKNGPIGPTNLLFYICTVTGGVSLTLAPLVLIGWFKSWRSLKREMVSFVFVPSLILILVIPGWYLTDMGIHFQPIIPLMVCFAVYGGLAIGLNPRVLSLIFVFYLIEHFYVLWYLRYDLVSIFSPDLSGSNYTMILTAVFILSIWYILVINRVALTLLDKNVNR